MEVEDKNLLSRWKEDWRKHFFRPPTRRRWALLGLVGSFAMLYYSLAFPPGPGTGGAYFRYFGLLEGVGLLFGSAAELLPGEQTTLAGILRMWAGLFAVCGAALMFAGIFLLR